jgi:hypothetical protein
MLCCQGWERHAVTSPSMNAIGIEPPKHAYTRQPEAGYACAPHVWQPYPGEVLTLWHSGRLRLKQKEAETSLANSPAVICHDCRPLYWRATVNP